MTTISWDQTGSRVYESGVDRGVLYLPEGGAVPWNGLISVIEKLVGNESSPVYFDGVKYSDSVAPGDYSATLKAYTYPDEFLELDGIVDSGNGLYVANQEPKRFGLSYRTRIGNDVDGDSAGYKIHVLYNLLATPSERTYQGSSETEPIEFEWNLSAIPGNIEGFRPSAHLIFDTREMGPLLIEDIERTLYGNEFSVPRLPDISTLVSFISDWVILRITENFDGTWTATGPDSLFSMLDGTTFQIIQANAEYLDTNTYEISDLTY